MFQNLLKHSFRALNRQKGYVFLNILGLSIGIACSLVIILFIVHEHSFDQFNQKKDRIYRLILNGKIGGQELNVAYTAAPIGPTMLRDFPEVEDFTRINAWGETILKNDTQSFTETAFIEADSSFFNIFSIPLLVGDPKEALASDHSLVLSQSTAKKIFGNNNPMDKMLKVGDDSVLYRVTGVMADIPEASHIRANVIGSFMSNPRSKDNEWLSNSFETDLLLKPNTDRQQVEAKIPAMLQKYVGPQIQQILGVSIEDFLAKGNKYNMYLQPLSDIHLNTSIQQDMKQPSDPKYLLIFGSIALLIILIAAINFMNLSTAQASKRAKEVGIKKVSGSTRGMLVGQFIAESVLLTFGALILAIIIVELAFPYFNNLLETELRLNYFGYIYTIPALITLAIAIGLLSGSYPAFYLSSFNPYDVLKGKIRASMRNGRLRSVLVVLQFTISIMLIVGTIVIFRQIQFMLNKNLGFNKEQLVVITRAETIGPRIKAFKESMKSIPGVVSVSASTAVPGHNNNNNGYMMEGRAQETFLMQTNWVDYDFLKTYDIKLDTGRFFSQAFPTDQNACVVNQSVVKQFNLVNPLATRFINARSMDDSSANSLMPIIGVVKDFNFESLRFKITPYVMRFKKEGNNWGYITIRIMPKDIPRTMESIEKVWADFTSNDPFQYFFFDDDFARLYKEEKQNAQLAVLFAILAIFIASLGLLGLTSFAVEQRTKEIGIRKTMGASVTSIFFLISKEIIVLVTIATVIALPITYYFANAWLQNYYYRITLSPFDFLAGFLAALLVAIATISYQTIKAAKANPVDSLIYE